MAIVVAGCMCHVPANLEEVDYVFIAREKQRFRWFYDSCIDEDEDLLRGTKTADEIEKKFFYNVATITSDTLEFPKRDVCKTESTGR